MKNNIIKIILILFSPHLVFIHLKKIPNEKILTHPRFMISYNTSFNSPNYCIYKLNYEPKIKNKKSNYIKNRISFYPYKIDYGHLIPKADIQDGSVNILENLVPQYSQFNRGIWLSLEKFIRNKYLNKIILTAPKYDLNNFIEIQNKTVYIPIGFYKIIFNDNGDIINSIYLNHEIEYNKLDFIFTNNIFYNEKPYFI